MANTIQFRRGTSVPSSNMNAGEPLFKTNDARFYIATGASTANWVGAPILDEDNMASDSALKLATQQSIKAYVDAQVATADAFSELTDTVINSPQAGHVAIYDGTNSWDNKALSGDATLNAAGQMTIANDAFKTLSAMENDTGQLDGNKYHNNNYMAKPSLHKVAKYAEKLLHMIPDGYELDDWQRTKIAQISDDISEVYHSLDYDFQGEEY